MKKIMLMKETVLILSSISTSKEMQIDGSLILSMLKFPYLILCNAYLILCKVSVKKKKHDEIGEWSRDNYQEFGEESF